jgi:hypothetical protein
MLLQKAFLPLNTWFDVGASSPYYNEESKTSISWAKSLARGKRVVTVRVHNLAAP